MTLWPCLEVGQKESDNAFAQAAQETGRVIVSRGVPEPWGCGTKGHGQWAWRGWLGLGLTLGVFPALVILCTNIPLRTITATGFDFLCPPYFPFSIPRNILMGSRTEVSYCPFYNNTTLHFENIYQRWCKKTTRMK